MQSPKENLFQKLSEKLDNFCTSLKTLPVDVQKRCLRCKTSRNVEHILLKSIWGLVCHRLSNPNSLS